MQSDDDDVEDTDTVKRWLTVTQQLRQLEAVLYHCADAEPYTRTHTTTGLLAAMSLVRFTVCVVVVRSLTSLSSLVASDVLDIRFRIRPKYSTASDIATADIVQILTWTYTQLSLCESLVNSIRLSK